MLRVSRSTANTLRLRAEDRSLCTEVIVLFKTSFCHFFCTFSIQGWLPSLHFMLLRSLDYPKSRKINQVFENPSKLILVAFVVPSLNYPRGYAFCYPGIKDGSYHEKFCQTSALSRWFSAASFTDIDTASYWPQLPSSLQSGVAALSHPLV